MLEATVVCVEPDSSSRPGPLLGGKSGLAAPFRVSKRGEDERRQARLKRCQLGLSTVMLSVTLSQGKKPEMLVTVNVTESPLKLDLLN